MNNLIGGDDTSIVLIIAVIIIIIIVIVVIIISSSTITTAVSTMAPTAVSTMAPTAVSTMAPTTLTTAAPSSDPCNGLADDSLASNVTPACLQKLWLDSGCTKDGDIYPNDNYKGWWNQSPQGTKTVYCDANNSGDKCGAGSFGGTKTDIKAWGSMNDDVHVAGCKGPTIPYQYYQGLDSGGNDIANKPGALKDMLQTCTSDPNCRGFNTNGWMKNTILPKNQWDKWTDEKDKGFYVKKNVQRYEYVSKPNEATKNYNDIKKDCDNIGMRLCNASELCTSGAPNAGLDIFQGQDNWIAVNDKENEWFTFNKAGDRTCKTHTQVAGDVPAWGPGATAGGWYRAGKCCNK